MGRLLVPVLLVAIACSPRTTAPDPTPTPAPTPAPAPIRVTMLVATAGFHHDSLATARDVMRTLAAQSSGAFVVSSSDDATAVTPAALSSTDVLMFALTSGELPFSAAQKDAIVAFVTNGGGFIGVHSATDTLYDWPDYGRIVGAYFKEHPWTREATVTVEDRAHPIHAGLPATLRLNEEYYTFRQNPRPSVHVMLTLDAASVGAVGDYPLAWTQTIGRGRSYYNALGHFDATWRDQAFQSQITNAIRWTANKN